MALTPSGQISMSDINSALGRSSTASINFNDANVRFLANQESGSVTMGAMRSKYYFVGTITIAHAGPGSSSYGYDLGSYGGITGNAQFSYPIDRFLSWDGPTETLMLFSNNNYLPFYADARMKLASTSTITMLYFNDKSQTWECFGTKIFGPGNVGTTQTWQLGSF